MAETLAQPKLSKYFSATAYWFFSFSLFSNDVQPLLSGISPAISLLVKTGKHSPTQTSKAEPQTGRDMGWICLQAYTTLESNLAVPLTGLFWLKSRKFLTQPQSKNHPYCLFPLFEWKSFQLPNTNPIQHASSWRQWNLADIVLHVRFSSQR